MTTCRQRHGGPHNPHPSSALPPVNRARRVGTRRARSWVSIGVPGVVRPSSRWSSRSRGRLPCRALNR